MKLSSYYFIFFFSCILPSVLSQLNTIGALESSNNEGYYISNQNFLGLIRQVQKSDLACDFIFKFVPGLAGSGISFESTNYPGYYLRHQDFRIKLHKNDSSPLFQKDATFNVIGETNGFRYQSVNLPDRFIRHRDNKELWIDQQDNIAESFRGDSTFKFHKFFNI